MSQLNALQLAVALAFPLGLLALLISVTAAHRGRTRRQILVGLGVIAACVAGAVAVSVYLRGTRGYGLVEVGPGTFGLGDLRAADAAGIGTCLLLLIGALLTARRLVQPTAGEGAPSPDTEGEAAPTQQPR